MHALISAFCAAALCGGLALAQDGAGIFVPAKQVPLYQTRHGEPAGYPGCLPDAKKEDGTPQYPAWGNPELQLYPGSVEHYRGEQQKYLPSWALVEATSLVKNFRLTDLPAAAGKVEDYAEPVYYVPMYGEARDTGKRNPPVKVVRMKAGAPVFKLDLGALDPSLYCIRLIGAAATPDTVGIRKPVYVEIKVNDGPGGEVTRYRLRCGYVDEFYSVAEFYFYAPAKRGYTAEVSLGDGTQADILGYNIDLHNAYTGLARQPVKQRANTFDVAQRDKAREELKARIEKKDTAWLADARKRNLVEYDLAKPYRAVPLEGEARRQRDDELWNALPPPNSQTYGQYGTAPRGTYCPEYADAAKETGAWAMAGKWDSRWEMRLAKDRRAKDSLATYTLADLAAFKPLPEPWPYREDAGGLTMKEAAKAELKYPSTLCTIATMNTLRIDDYTKGLAGHPQHRAGLAAFYHFTGDREAARDAAMALVRVAYLLPTWDESRLSVNAAVVGRTPDLNWGGKDQWTTRRLTRTDAGLYSQGYLEAYDRLFDFIRGNEELAQAAGRFVPWVRNAKDLQTFLDMNLVQYTAKRMARWHMHHNDLMAPVMAAGNTDFTRPWMDFLFRETWVYPQARAGMPDYAITSTQRDGTSYIGSWFYAMDGGAAMQFAEKTREYVDRGGDARYDMSDFRRFPKALAACNFQIEGRAAGLHALGVGDVNGPNLAYGHWFTLGSPEHQARIGWQWSKDPKYAYALANYFGQKEESAAEWEAILAAAKDRPNPWFAQRSRVLNNWASVLEGGTQHMDFRFRRAAMLRVGYGWGHQHNDPLDLIAWCHGVIHAAVGGERPEQRQLGDIHEPKNQSTVTHNMVEVDGEGGARSGQHRGYSWARELKDTEGVQYTLCEASPSINHPYITLYRRQAALIDLNEGTPLDREPSTPREFAPSFKLPKATKTADAYIFDVVRVAGGKRHTYCFHGCEEDEFATNAQNVRKVGFTYGANADTSPEARYLTKFTVADSKTAGVAPKVLEATWRLQREGDGIAISQADKDAKGENQPVVKKTMKRANTEQRILGVNYDADSPRKYTRLLLLGHEGGKVLTGKWVATSPGVSLQCLFAQRDLAGELPEGQPGNLESVFPAIIEMYEGAPVIASVRGLDVQDNEQDALRAAAVEVTLTDGRKDLCFSDGRPGKARSVAGGVAVTAAFACLSTDAKGLRMAEVVGGTNLAQPGLVALQPAAAARVGKVVEVSYFDKKVVVEGMAVANAALLKGALVELGTADHRTSYMVRDAAVAGGRVTLTLDKGADFYSSRVASVDEKTGVVRCGLGFPTDDSVVYPGMSKGLVASNESLTRFWRAEFQGGTREDGYTFQLTGAPVTAADFGEKGALRIWEFGVGDEARIATHAALRRNDDGTWLYQGDVACALELPGPALESSPDGVAWTPVKAEKLSGNRVRFTLGEAALGNGRMMFRAAK